MNTFLIAQHHGAFLTLQSMIDCGIDNITVIIPGSQVEKYNKMYSDNPHNPEFIVFKDYDKSLSAFAKSKGLNIKTYVVDNFDVRNTLVSTLRVIKDLNYNEIVTCIMSGVVVIRDYRPFVKDALLFKEYGMCKSRVYENDHNLAMYHMIGLPKNDSSMDLNFFITDITKVNDNSLNFTDSQLLSDALRRKQITTISREFNGKDDPLIGTAISARQTIAHNLKIQAGFVVNLWNKCIKPNTMLKSEEIYGYPFDVYSRHVQKISSYLPDSTVNKILSNGIETEKCTGGLYECLDIIDL